MINKSLRVDSIDVFRALTMLLMIFVNDLWTLQDIPSWLEHKAAEVDGMGLADVVFPAFLFIVGLSIPFAISARLKKGHDIKKIASHIVIRSLALIIMGLYMVNLENYNSELSFMNKYVWEILMATGIFLIWNQYPQKPGKQKYLFRGLQTAGILLLVFLAVIYKGGSVENPSWMKTYWWGILGLIGWAYFISAFVYLLAGNRLWILLAALLFFNAFNIAVFAGWLDFISGIKRYIWLVGNGSMPAYTMGGVVASVIYTYYREKNKIREFLGAMFFLAILMFAIGFGTRPFWGISKIWATPAWVGICTGISYVSFGLLFFLVDIRKKRNWFSFIDPAGTSTLTTYLVPYFYYSIMTLAGWSLPMIFRTGIVGIIKSIFYALLVVQITGLLGRVKIKLRI